MLLNLKHIETGINICTLALERAESDQEKKEIQELLNKFQAQSYFESYRVAVLSQAHTQKFRDFISLGRRVLNGVVYTSGKKGDIEKIWMNPDELDISNLTPDKSNYPLTEKERQVLSKFVEYGFWEGIGTYFVNGEPQQFLSDGKVYFKL